jgi:hypothetical protein
MTSKRAFNISHDWGDPREPEHRNGLPVLHLLYSENGRGLSFRVFGIRMNDPTVIDWYLEAPQNTRAVLGLRWRERWIIYQRIIDHLVNLKPPERLRSASDYSAIKVDESKIIGFVATIRGLANERLLPVRPYLPNPYIILTLLIGFLCLFVNSENYYPQLSPFIFKIFSFLLAIASVVQLIRVVQGDYERAKIIAAVTRFGNPKLDYRRFAMQLIITHGKWRYAITLVLAFTLAFLALSINA